jgi:hypothetical protein
LTLKIIEDIKRYQGKKWDSYRAVGFSRFGSRRNMTLDKDFNRCAGYTLKCFSWQ